MSSYYRTITHRTELVVGADSIEKFSDARVIIFGVGGVGSWCAEALVRSGITHLTIVDSDVVCATNVNRQIQATSETIGSVKVDEMKKRLLAINPDADIIAFNRPFTEETYAEFDVASYDYVVDAIDSLKNKCFLIGLCQKLQKKFISSMGAGARSDPSRIKTDKLSNTNNCSLARAVRQRLRQNKISTDFLCVYSDELPVKPKQRKATGEDENITLQDKTEAGAAAAQWQSQKKQINGALVHITGIFGFTIAATILRDIAGMKAIPIVKVRLTDDNLR